MPHEEDKVNEGPELDCSQVVHALGVFTLLDAEVEAQGDQVSDLRGLGIGGEGFYGDDGVNDTKWVGLFLFDWRSLQDVCPFQCGPGCRGAFFGRGAIQEVGCHNCPPCLRNQLFPKLVHSALGVLGMTDPVSIYLQGLNSREGRILESRAD